MSIIMFVVIAFFAYVIVNFIMDEKAPVETTTATLVRKDIDNYIDSNQIMNQTYILTFNINGNTKRFSVNYSTYNKYEEGQEGTISFKRNKFVEFVGKQES